MRLIDAEEAICGIVNDSVSDNDESIRATAKAIAVIQNAPTIEPQTTTWLGNYCPYTCQHCGHYSDSKTPFCAWCGRKASNYEV